MKGAIVVDKEVSEAVLGKIKFNASVLACAGELFLASLPPRGSLRCFRLSMSLGYFFIIKVAKERK